MENQQFEKRISYTSGEFSDPEYQEEGNQTSSVGAIPCMKFYFRS
jgi:hypothetical protein